MGLYNIFVKPFVRNKSMDDASRICLRYYRLMGKFPFARTLNRWFYGNKPSGLESDVFGFQFYNPVGLGAGLDIHGELYNDLSNLGVSFVEVGPVDADNVKNAIIHVQKDKPRDILALCIEKDFLTSFTLAYDFFDFFVVDLSADPSVEHVEPLLEARIGEQQYKPIVIKLPDYLTYKEIENFAEYSMVNNIDGIEIRSLDHLHHIYSYTKGRLPLIANSHIDAPERASEALKAGASLVEIRTGLVKEGPRVVSNTLKHLLKLKETKIHEESTSSVQDSQSA